MCASPEYLKLHGEPQKPSDLKSHQCLLYSYHDSIKSWKFEDKLGKKQQVSVDGPLCANNGNLICDALVNGMGITGLPTFIIGDAIRKGEAKIILDDWRIKPQDISLIYPSSRHLSAKVRTFVDLAVEHFKPADGEVNEWDKDLPL